MGKDYQPTYYDPQRHENILSREDEKGVKHWKTAKREPEKKDDDGYKPDYVFTDKTGKRTHEFKSRVDDNGMKHRKVVKLKESDLHRIIKESVMDEIDRRTVMPGKYYEIFKNRIINAQHGSFGDVDRTIMEFFKDFKDRIPNEGFTPENLKDLAEKIEGGDTTHERGNMPGGHKVKDADGWWGMNAGKYLEEKKVRLTEGQLRKLIKESVMKAIMNEISSDMIGRAKDKFLQKYGNPRMFKDGVSEPLLKDPTLKTNRPGKYASPLHPKDNRPLSKHLSDFEMAYDKAKRDEEDPEIARKAQELYNQVELEQEVSDWVDPPYGCSLNLWGEIEDENGGVWKFEGWGSGVNAGGGDIELDSIDEMNYESPDGQTGSIQNP